MCVCVLSGFKTDLRHKEPEIKTIPPSAAVCICVSVHSGFKTALRPKKPEIKTIDQFQGSEKEVIILSLVRSAEEVRSRDLGFITDSRRVNVALTRAKSLVIILMDTKTYSADALTWRGYIRHALKNHLVLDAAHLPQDFRSEIDD